MTAPLANARRFLDPVQSRLVKKQERVQMGEEGAKGQSGDQTFTHKKDP
jgi:hypothetical protein